MDTKKIGACGAGFIAALLYGGAELMNLAARVEAIEKIHPELQENEDENKEEDGEESEEKSEDENPPALGKPGMSAPPLEDPRGPEGEEGE